jgi:uncharacterized membrane protein (Fun14 family)
MDSQTSLLLAQVATEATAGGVTGFLIGYGVRQVAAIALKIVAIGTALLMIPLVWLSSMGILKVEFAALGNGNLESSSSLVSRNLFSQWESLQIHGDDIWEHSCHIRIFDR